MLPRDHRADRRMVQEALVPDDIHQMNSPGWLKNLALAIASIALFFIGTEATLRVWISPDLAIEIGDVEAWWRNRWINDAAPAGGERVLTSDSPRMVFSPDLGWSPKPNLNLAGASTNSRGQRAPRDLSYAKPSGVSRVVVMGDSYTWGAPTRHGDPPIRDAALYTATMEKELRGSEVINLGVPGFGVDQMLLYFRMEGIKYQPDLVIVAIYVDDFHRATLSFREYAKPRLRLRGRDLIWPARPVDPPDVTRSRAAPIIPRCYSCLFTAGKFRVAALRFAPLGWLDLDRLSWAILDEFKRESLQHQARLLMVMIPHCDLSLPVERAEKLVGEWGRASATPVLPLRQALGARSASDRDSICQGQYAAHWTEYGHQVVGELIAREITRLKLIPESRAGSSEASQ